MSVAMHATFYPLPEDPRWQREVRARLARSLTAATALLACGLALLQFPVAQVIRPAPEILVRLLPQIIAPLPEIPAAEEAPPKVTEPAAAPQDRVSEENTDMPEAAEAPSTSALGETVAPDWYGEIPEAAKEAVDEMERIAAQTINPMMDEKRRVAAEKFYASLAPEQKKIWDNVETDQMGRKILRAGDCYRIIDDPNPANYEIFQLQQNLVYCSIFGFGADIRPKPLPWVDDIVARYLYLKYPDGEIPIEELQKYVKRQ